MRLMASVGPLKIVAAFGTVNTDVETLRDGVEIAKEQHLLRGECNNIRTTNRVTVWKMDDRVSVWHV